MFKSQCLLLCLCFVAGSYATDNLVPFIDKCEWSDKPCLKKSTEKALPYFAQGLPQIGLKPMDPLEMSKVTLAEGELKIDFSKMTVTGASKCIILSVERDINTHKLKLSAKCPIDVVGDYKASGKLIFADIEGQGPFQVSCKLIQIDVEVDLNTIEKDGVKYWKISNPKHSYEAVERCTFNLENLFNGDKTKAEPVLSIFNESWKQVMETTCKPIVEQIVSKIMGHMQTMCEKVSADQLEK